MMRFANDDAMIGVCGGWQMAQDLFRAFGLVSRESVDVYNGS